MNKLMAGLILCIFIFLTTASCAHFKTESKSKSALSKRITAVWEYKVNKEWGSVYNFLASSVKKKMSRNSFIKRANLNVLSFSIKSISIDEPDNKALVKIKYRIKQRGFDFNFSTQEEWLWENGGWFLNLRTGFLPMAKPGRQNK